MQTFAGEQDMARPAVVVLAVGKDLLEKVQELYHAGRLVASSLRVV